MYSQVAVVDAERVVEPVDLAVDELAGHEAGLDEDVGNGLLLLALGREGRGHITTDRRQRLLNQCLCTEAYPRAVVRQWQS